MGLLSRDNIMDAKDLVTEDVPVPEWGGDLRIKMLTGAERDEYETSMVRMGKNGKQETDLVNLRARLVAKCAVNEDGTKMFQTRNEVAHLGMKSAAALDRVYTACQKLNGMGQKDVEELVEDFDNTPDENSTSDSH